MTRISVHDVNYNVEIKGSGIPLVMLHGFTGSAHSWHHAERVFAEYYTVYAIDLLGHGRSDKPQDPARYDMLAAACDLVRLFEVLSFSPVNLLGYSMGGRLALFLALNFPEVVKTLVLESASPGIADPIDRAVRRERDNALADRIEQDGIPAFVDYWESIQLFTSQSVVSDAIRAELHQQRLNNEPHGLANSLRGMGTGVQPSLWGDLHLLHQPALLLSGELDQKFVDIAQHMQSQARRTRHTIVPGAGHTIHLEKPDDFTTQVITFVHMAQFSALGKVSA